MKREMQLRLKENYGAWNAVFRTDFFLHKENYGECNVVVKKKLTNGV